MTYSEDLFDRYLKQIGYKPQIDYFYNYKINNNPPVDFYIKKVKPGILVEIKEFNPYGKQSKRKKQLKKEGVYDGYSAKDLREKIDAIKNQFKPYKDSNYICIGIIQDNPAFIAFNAHDIAEAMFGDLHIQITSVDSKEYCFIFKGNAAMSNKKNTRISAICSLTSVENESNSVLRDGNVVKCISVLNHYSKKNIPHSFFSGPRDEVWQINYRSRKLEQV